MRKELTIVIVILLAGVLVAYNWFGGAPMIFHPLRGVVNLDGGTVAAPTPVYESAEKTTPRKVKRESPQAAPLEETLPLSVSQPSVGAITPAECCERTPLPFPTPDTLKKGSTAAEIRAAFGAPAVHVAGTSPAGVRETYYYFSPEQHRLTIAKVENGVLISAESTPSPYFKGVPKGGNQ